MLPILWEYATIFVIGTVERSLPSTKGKDLFFILFWFWRRTSFVSWGSYSIHMQAYVQCGDPCLYNLIPWFKCLAHLWGMREIGDFAVFREVDTDFNGKIESIGPILDSDILICHQRDSKVYQTFVPACSSLQDINEYFHLSGRPHVFLHLHDLRQTLFSFLARATSLYIS